MRKAAGGLFQNDSPRGRDIEPIPAKTVPRKKLAYLISQYPAVNHTFILREVRGLRELGLEICTISILCPDRAPEAMSAEEREELASTLYVRPKGILFQLRALGRALLQRPVALFKGIKASLALSRWNLFTAAKHCRYLLEALVVGFWMQEQQLRHIHTHFASTVALLVRVMFPVQMSSTIHGPDEFNDPVGFLLREKIESAEFVVAISYYGRSQLMRFVEYDHWHKLKVIRLGVNTSEYSPTPRLDSSQRPLEVICVGRLAPAKGQHLLIEACAQLVRQGHSLVLRLVGGGPDRQSLESLVKALHMEQHVFFLGPLPHHKVLDLYRAADLFALASFAEGIPVVLMEAMALTLPCVATTITGIPELIRHEVEGILVPPSDVEALASAIRRLETDAPLRQRLGIAGRERVLNEYDIHRNIRLLAEQHIGFEAAEITL